MQYQYFVFNGVNSLDMGVVMLKAPPVIKPEKRVNEIEIAGRNGVLHEDTEVYSNYTKEIECVLLDNSRIYDVCAWLNGYGEVIFSSEKDFVYRGFIKNQIPINNILLNINDFLIQFDVYPLKYSVNKTDDFLVITENTEIYNKGTEKSEPIITVYGSGDITLIINDIEYVLEGVKDYITIDSSNMEVYKDSMELNSQNDKYKSRDFPIFNIGFNSISFSGNVSKIEIEPEWRWV